VDLDIKGWDVSLNAWYITNMYYTFNDDEVPGYNYDDTDLTYDDGQSRLFVNFKNGPYKGLFEIRAGENVTGADTLFYYWMEYDFGVGRVMLGQHDPLTWDAILLPPPVKSGIAHMLGHSVAPGIYLTFPIGDNGTEIAVSALKPDDWSQFVSGGYIVPTAVDEDHLIPSLEARLNLPVGNFKMALSGGYDMYSEVDATDKEYDINSYMFGASVRYFQPDGDYILEATLYKDHNNYSHGGPPNQKGYYWYAAFGAAFTSDYYGDPKYDEATDSIIDSDYVGYALGVNYFFNETISLHVGVSQGWTEDDYGNEDPSIGYEIIANIKLTDFLYLTPFFHVTDWLDRTPVGEDSIEEGKTTVLGTQVSIMF
jgi:hypothetical protein